MENSNERVKYLIIQHLKGKLTIHEQLELQEWVNSANDHQEIFDQFSDPDRLKDELKEYSEARTRTWEKIDGRIKTPIYIEGPAESNNPAIHPIRRHLRAYIAAASLLGVVVIGYTWLRLSFTPSETRPVWSPVAARDVAPGSDKAVLTLANDSNIVLENAANGSLTTQGSAQVVKDKRSLSYTVTASDQGESAPTAMVFNTLTTPRAGQFQLVLPDGTKVWLNNASSLRYPTNFSGTTREVQLTGEAYFEVAKNSSQPFLVKASKATIQVLGTSFNVMAYYDEPVIRTTLLTGKVSIGTATHKSILSPGEQGVLDQDGIITVAKDIDTDEVIAWQKGFFNFTGSNLNDVLRQLARWYDVEVVYTAPPPAKYTCDGEIGRNLNLITILKHLERKDVHFKLEGNRLIVSR
jgi:ferric-dicitrate binding protein FerR (iron transport regulator)